MAGLETRKPVSAACGISGEGGEILRRAKPLNLLAAAG